MKKLFILASLMFVLPFVANAASFVITPFSGSYTSGDIVTLRISVDPAGSTIYTAMLDAKLSPNTFEIISFSLNDSMLAMKQAGYDSTDSTNGVLIKTGGYTGGISSVTYFGTLTLRAKTSGTGKFTANSTSKLLDENNVNKQTGSQSASFTIANKVPVVVPNVEAKKSVEVKTSIKTETPTEVQKETTSNEPVLYEVEVAPTQVAAVVESEATKGVMFWMIEILVMLAMFGLGYIAGSRSLTRRLNK